MPTKEKIKDKQGATHSTESVNNRLTSILIFLIDDDDDDDDDDDLPTYRTQLLLHSIHDSRTCEAEEKSG